MRLFSPERTEMVRFQLNLDHDQYRRVQNVLGDFAGGRFDKIGIAPGETVSVTFDFTIEFYNVVKQLRALTSLLAEPDLIVSVSLEERRGFELVLVELVDAVREVQNELARR